MRRINHQLIRRSGLGCKACKYLVEYAHTAPANEPVVDRLVWAILSRSVPPLQTVTDDKDNPTVDPPIINPWNAVPKATTALSLGGSLPRLVMKALLVCDVITSQSKMTLLKVIITCKFI